MAQNHTVATWLRFGVAAVTVSEKKFPMNLANLAARSSCCCHTKPEMISALTAQDA
jgi:hypothetical protein